MRKPVRESAVLKYLDSVPHATASQIQKAINMKQGNIYTVLKKLKEKRQISRNEESKRYFIDRRMPLFSEKREEPKPNPLINIFLKEIEYVQEGIDNLETTKTYLERRVAQLRQREANRARLN